MSDLQIVARMSNARDDSVFTVPSSVFSNNYVVCDNEAHTVILTVQSSGLSIKVDHYASHLTKYPSQFQLPTAAELPVYVGGVKGKSSLFKLHFQQMLYLNVSTTTQRTNVLKYIRYFFYVMFFTVSIKLVFFYLFHMQKIVNKII